MNALPRILVYSVILVLAIAATLSSFLFVRPVNCQDLCSEPAQAPCPPETCRFGEQRAGFPFSMVRDAETGSPTGGWGKLGEEDYFYINLFAVFGNTIFYGAVFWLLRQLPHALRLRQVRVQQLVPMLYVGIGLLSGFFNYRPPAPWQPPATDNPAVAIFGTWRGTDPISGAPLFFRFYEDQRVVWSHSFDRGSNAGQYTWVDDHTIQLVVENLGEISTCARQPTILADVCQAQIFRPTASPIGAQLVAPTATPLDANASPVPTPPPYDSALSTIDALMTVTVDTESLTLSLSSGRTQTLQRMTGETMPSPVPDNSAMQSTG